MPSSYYIFENQAYPASARNLNRLTKVVDVDLYNKDGEKEPLVEINSPIKVIVGRMKEKDVLGVLDMPGATLINLYVLSTRNNKLKVATFFLVD